MTVREWMLLAAIERDRAAVDDDFPRHALVHLGRHARK
jgi:hypothetical protein